MKELISAAKSLCQQFKTVSLREQMKTKNFYIILAFLAATSVSLWLLSNPTPNFNTIVSQTHRQISNIKSIPSNIRNSNLEEFNVDKKLLENLGFESEVLDSSTVADKGRKTKDVPIRPVIAVPALPHTYDKTLQHVKSAHKFLRDYHIVVYDLGLNSYENIQMKKHCNKTFSCDVKNFDFGVFPSHLRDLNIPSYRPILIQKTLDDFNTVIWSEPSEDFISSQFKSLLKRAKTVGIVAWTTKDPVSSITYVKMYKYFKTKPEDYYFQETAKLNHIIIHNTDKIHKKVMLPWVKCALSEDCINPIGASNSGSCKKGIKPLYLYSSGCHKYDVAALNIVLGQVFPDVSEYKTDEKLFGTLLETTPSTKDEVAIRSS